MGAGTYLVGVVFALLIAAIYPNVSTTIAHLNLFGAVEVIPNKTCKLVENPWLSGCEDGQLHTESSQIYFACSSLPDRQKFFPPLEHFHDRKLKHRGVIAIMDLKTRNSHILEFETEFEFNPHGLGLVTDPKNDKVVLLALVNHKQSGSVVERFKHVIGTSKLEHYETVQDQFLLNNPSDVVPITERTFYATNDFKANGSGLIRKYEKFTRRPSGHVVYYDGKKLRIVAKDIVYANGIIKHKEYIYVTSMFNWEIRKYEIQENKRLRLLDIIDVGFGAINLSIEPTSGDIYATGTSHIMAFFKASNDYKSNKSPTLVKKISVNIEKDQFYGKKVFYINSVQSRNCFCK